MARKPSTTKPLAIRIDDPEPPEPAAPAAKPEAAPIVVPPRKPSAFELQIEQTKAEERARVESAAQAKPEAASVPLAALIPKAQPKAPRKPKPAVTAAPEPQSEPTPEAAPELAPEAKPEPLPPPKAAPVIKPKAKRREFTKIHDSDVRALLDALAEDLGLNMVERAALVSQETSEDREFFARYAARFNAVIDAAMATEQLQAQLVSAASRALTKVSAA